VRFPHIHTHDFTFIIEPRERAQQERTNENDSAVLIERAGHIRAKEDKSWDLEESRRFFQYHYGICLDLIGTSILPREGASTGEDSAGKEGLMGII